MSSNKCDYCHKNVKLIYKLPEIDNNNICGYCMTSNLNNWVKNKYETKETRRVLEGVTI